MGKRHKFPIRDVESNSSSTSSSDDTSPDKARRRKRRSQSSVNAWKTEDKDNIRMMLQQLNEQMLEQLNEQMRKQSMQLTESNSEIRKQMGNLIESQNKEMKKLIESQNGQMEKLIESQNGQSKELEKLTASINNYLRKQLEFDTNITVHAESDAPRSRMNQVPPPRYRLVFRSAPIDKIETGKTIEISVALVEATSGRPVENGPLASATVELVIVNSKFNQHDNQHNWSKEDFERNIVKPRCENSAAGGADQSVKSIVSNGRFNLDRGVGCYSGSTIFENSHNRKVRLAAMAVSPTEERVLEALSNPLLVRDHVQSGKQSNLQPNSSNGQRSNIIGGQSQLPFLGSSNMLSREPFTSQEQQSFIQQYQSPYVPMVAQATYNQNGQALGDNDYQEENSSMPNLQQPLWPNSTHTGGIRSNIIGGQSQAQLPFLGSSNMLYTEPFTSQEQQSFIQQYQSPHAPMVAQATYNQNIADELASPSNYLVRDPNFMVNDHVLGHAIDMQSPTILRPVQLVWDRPIVGPIKRDWDLLDQLMQLPKFSNCGLPTKRLMQEHLVYSRTIMSMEVMQARRNTGVIIEPLEPDDSDDERQLKRKMCSKYEFRFENGVCEGYHIRDPIKADDGNPLKVALFDGNRKITNGPLSSVPVKFVALHGDFNDHGQDHWTSEEFNCCEVCPQPGEEASSVLGGDCILVLSDGEACLGDVFFQMTSYCARTGKFKMGVKLASSQEERIQGVSESFWVTDRHSAGECGLGIGPEDDTARINHPSVVQATMAELVTGPLLYTLKNKAPSCRYNADFDRLQHERDAAIMEVAELREKNQQRDVEPSEAQNITFSLVELQQATQDFDEKLKIGDGGFGSVYKGILRNTTVAIKLPHSQSMQGQSEFHQEVSVLSKVRHPNLVTLIGTCPEAFGLVYKFFPNGSLEDGLACKNNKPPLPWQIRTRIVGEICLALIFLHSNKPHPMVHGDLKPDNILLDANYSSKLGDFGICRCLIQTNTCSTTLHRTMNPRGTFYYMDPEFLTTGELTTRSDVYSFGIIILRLLTGKPPQGIAEIVKEAIEQGNLHSIIDTSAGSWPLIQANQLAHIGLRCTELSRRRRPDLTVDVWKVVEPLMKAASMTARPLSGTNLSDDTFIPSHFICPILQEIMNDPYIAADGFTYEGEAIKGWLDSGHSTSPVTNLKLEHSLLVPNRALRSAILEWQQKEQP